MALYQCLLLFHFALLCLVDGQMYYIISDYSTTCPSNQLCITLSDVSSNATFKLDIRINLRFFPGHHYLDSTLYLSNVTNIELSVVDEAAVISCSQFASFVIHGVDSIVINGLRFIGCGDTSFTHASNLTVLDSSFERVSDFGTALLLNGIAATRIRNCSFSLNIQGSEKPITDFVGILNTNGNNYSNGTVRVGGALTILNSENVLVEGTLFDGNNAQYGGAIFVDQNNEIIINGCVFHSNKAASMLLESGTDYGGGAALFVNNSRIIISNSTFVNNSLTAFPSYQGTGGVLQISKSVISIRKSSFVYNKARNGKGGVIYALQLTSLLIENCFFSSNEAHIAGVMYIEHSTILLTNNSFYRNGLSLSQEKGGLAAIALYNSEADFVNNSFVDNTGSLFVYNATVHFGGITDFYNCTTTSTGMQNVILQEGGSISAYSSHLTFSGYTSFNLNSAKYGGALFAVKSTISIAQTRESSESPEQRLLMQNNTAIYNGGGMYLYQSSLTIGACECYLISNGASGNGGGIFAHNSDIRLLEQININKRHTLLLDSNRAQLGGGFYFQGTSKVTVFASSNNVEFTNNCAQKGSAIYIDDYTQADQCNTSLLNTKISTGCFFDSHHVSPPMESTFLFNNSAECLTSTIFGGLLDRCLALSFTGNIPLSIALEETNKNGLTYFQKVSNLDSLMSITSEPIKVCLCTNGLPNCTISTLSIQVKKGENFSLQVAAVDQVLTPAESARILALLSSNMSKLAHGQRAQFVSNCTDITYSVSSSLDLETLTLYADGPCIDAQPSRLTLSLEFSACVCPIGFERSRETPQSICDCTCSSLISEYIEDCQVSTASFVKKKPNSWISYTISNNESTYIVSDTCPFTFCSEPSSTPLRMSLNVTNGTDVQCSEGRTGLLCGTCATNYSISIGLTRCVQCSKYWYLITLGLIFVHLLVGLGITVGIIVTNFTVSIGTINGFIFYVNIVDLYQTDLLPFKTPTFPSLVIQWLNLHPGGIDACFIKNGNVYLHIWFGFIFPIYIILLVVGIIVISNRSQRFSRLLAKRNPVATLATLVLLSYMSIVEIALLAISPETLKYITSNGAYSEIVWKLDGSIKYFEAKHAILFFVALVLIVLTIAYKLFIFFWQWIIRLPKVWILKWTRNQKLNLYIRAHHVPYCDQHRYWTGLLLLVRALLILISAFSKDRRIALVSLVITLGVVFMLKMTFAKKVYKMWPVDVLEIVLMFNLFILASITLYAIEDVNIRRTAVYISVTITFILLLCVIAYHIYAYIIIVRWPALKIGQSSVKFYPAKRRSELEGAPAYVDYTEDRFHDLIGSIEIQPQVPNQVLRPLNKTVKESSVVATTSVLQTLDLQEGHAPEQLTTIEEESISQAAPYVMMDSSEYSL